ncbi:hypothetical protein BHM03_00040260 [Ensete ventricosum]|nr:hypothetical protein BHM03_00040260 [Ensete ventricosum]
MVRSAMQKAKSSLIKEQCATLERAQMTIAKYKETLSFKLNVEKIGQLRVWVSVKRDFYSSYVLACGASSEDYLYIRRAVPGSLCRGHLG